MDEEQALKFANYIDNLSEDDPDYGLDMFFRIQGDLKDQCLEMISKIEEIDLKISKTSSRSEKGSLSCEKGILLEKLAAKILSVRNLFSRKERVLCDSNEIDILLQPATNTSFYNSLLPEYLKKDFLIECKNHKKPIDVTLLGKFYSLMRYKKSKFGIMFSNLPLTGQSVWEDSVGLTKKLYLRDDTIIINITIERMKEILEKNINIIAAIKKEVNEIIYHTKFEDYISKHPAECIMEPVT